MVQRTKMPAISSPDSVPSNPPLLSIFILSCCALAYEVLLLRLFSIIHWHHFAFMVISLALLGYGASGSFLALVGNRLLQNFHRVFSINATAFGLSTIACFMIVQHAPFNTLEILWDPSQWLRLLYSYLLLSLPFFFVANAIALSLMRYSAQIGRIYGIDLIAAGAGALLILLIVHFLSLQAALISVAAGGIAAAFLCAYRVSRRRKPLVMLSLLSLLLIGMVPQSWLSLRISEYKGLPQTLQVKNTKLLQSHNSMIARTDVVASELIPFRYAPGLSLVSPASPPPQLAVFRDADDMHVIDLVGKKKDLEYQDYMSSALPYHVAASVRRVMILNAATGSSIQQARYFNVDSVTAVEGDGALVRLLQEDFAHLAGWDEMHAELSFKVASARGYAAASGEKYDLIILGASGSSTGGAAGVYDLSPSYDTTVEALQSYLNMLNPGGLLSLTQWTSAPAKANLKRFHSTVRAMKKNGIENPQWNLAWIRSWNTATLLIKNTRLSETELALVRRFSESRGFDLAWLPGIKQQEINRFHRLPQPVFHLAAKSILLDPQQKFIRGYKYNLDPISDKRPFGGFFFRWSSLQELMDLPASGGIALTGVGYPTLVITFLQALLAGGMLILLPLSLLKSPRQANARKQSLLYFLFIGLAFLFIEIAFIQQFSLIIGQPLYAVAVALCAFLVFSGVGSLYVQRYLPSGCRIGGHYALLTRSVLMILLIAGAYLLLLPRLTPTLMSLPESVRVFTAFLLTAPLAFFMGMPFAIGLSHLQRTAPQLIPWAWGVNGCASVLSAVGAVLLAMHVGFDGVMISALVLYLLAWIFMMRSKSVQYG